MRKQHGVLEGKQKKMRRVQRRSEKEMRKRSGLREARRKGGLSRLWYACLHPVTAYQTPVGQEVMMNSCCF